MGGIRPETKAAKKRKIRRKDARRAKPYRSLGIPSAAAKRRTPMRELA